MYGSDKEEWVIISVVLRPCGRVGSRFDSTLESSRTFRM